MQTDSRVQQLRFRRDGSPSLAGAFCCERLAGLKVHLGGDLIVCKCGAESALQPLTVRLYLRFGEEGFREVFRFASAEKSTDLIEPVFFEQTGLLAVVEQQRERPHALLTVFALQDFLPGKARVRAVSPWQANRGTAGNRVWLPAFHAIRQTYGIEVVVCPNRLYFARAGQAEFSFVDLPSDIPQGMHPVYCEAAHELVICGGRAKNLQFENRVFRFDLRSLQLEPLDPATRGIKGLVVHQSGNSIFWLRGDESFREYFLTDVSSPRLKTVEFLHAGKEFLDQGRQKVFEFYPKDVTVEFNLSYLEFPDRVEFRREHPKFEGRVSSHTGLFLLTRLHDTSLLLEDRKARSSKKLDLPQSSASLGFFPEHFCFSRQDRLLAIVNYLPGDQGLYLLDPASRELLLHQRHQDANLAAALLAFDEAENHLVFYAGGSVVYVFSVQARKLISSVDLLTPNFELHSLEVRAGLVTGYGVCEKQFVLKLAAPLALEPESFAAVAYGLHLHQATRHDGDRRDINRAIVNLCRNASRSLFWNQLMVAQVVCVNDLDSLKLFSEKVFSLDEMMKYYHLLEVCFELTDNKQMVNFIDQHIRKKIDSLRYDLPWLKAVSHFVHSLFRNRRAEEYMSNQNTKSVITQLMFFDTHETVVAELEELEVAAITSVPSTHGEEKAVIRAALKTLQVENPKNAEEYRVFRTAVDIDMNRGSEDSMLFFRFISYFPDADLKRVFKGLIYYKYDKVFRHVLLYSILDWINCAACYVFFGYHFRTEGWNWVLAGAIWALTGIKLLFENDPRFLEQF